MKPLTEVIFVKKNFFSVSVYSRLGPEMKFNYLNILSNCIFWTDFMSLLQPTE